jgi:two-component system OmpR family sensor kinase
MRRRLRARIPTSLSWRLSISYMAVLTLFLLLFSTFLYLAVQHILYTTNDTLFVAQATQMRNHFLTDVNGAPQLSLTQALADTHALVPDANQIYVVDAAGQILAGDGTIGAQAPYYSMQRVLAGLRYDRRNGKPLRVFFQVGGPSPARPVGVLVLPLRRSVQGYQLLELVTDYRNANGVLDGMLVALGLGIGALLLTALLIGVPLTRRALQPLERMTDIARRIASGDLSQRVRLPQGNDEIGRLAATFDEMIARIERAFAVQYASEQQMRQFVADASHELRTPLTSLRGYTDVLLRGAKDDPEVAERVLRAMRDEAGRMSRLVEDLLTLARLDAGRPMARLEIDLVALAGDAVDQARIMAANRLVLLRTDGLGPLPVQGDRDRLKQVLLILLDNALKYARPIPDAWVQVTVARKPGVAVLSVADNGRGIPPEDVPHIFERFYRGERARTHSQPTTTGGAGLGLAIARSIISAHQGQIEVSGVPDQGTTFTITLPVGGA